MRVCASILILYEVYVCLYCRYAVSLCHVRHACMTHEECSDHVALRPARHLVPDLLGLPSPSIDTDTHRLSSAVVLCLRYYIRTRRICVIVVYSHCCLVHASCSLLAFRFLCNECNTKVRSCFQMDGCPS